MSVMIQVRNVPDDVHRRAKARAALEGMTLSDWVLREVLRAIERPSRSEVLDRIASREAVDVDPTALLAAERDDP